jgi:hypothetical protein
MQYKRPLNLPKSRKTGVPTYVNSFQFLRANELVLSVKLERAGGRRGDTARGDGQVQGSPLTAQELAEWRAWKVKHDSRKRQDADLAVCARPGTAWRHAAQRLRRAWTRRRHLHASRSRRLWELTEVPKRLKNRARAADAPARPPQDRGR